MEIHFGSVEDVVQPLDADLDTVVSDVVHVVRLEVAEPYRSGLGTRRKVQRLDVPTPIQFDVPLEVAEYPRMRLDRDDPTGVANETSGVDGQRADVRADIDDGVACGEDLFEEAMIVGPVGCDPSSTAP